MKRKLLSLLVFLSAFTALMAQVQTQMPLPAHSSTFSGNVRGYYFVAPTCFTITGVQVPTEAGTGAQSIAIMRFPATPPLFSATTNTFTTLFLTQSNPNTGILPVNIQVEQGDIIGVLGQRGTANSYGTSGFSSNIAGFPTTLSRLGMQFPLTTTAPQQLWTENGGSISRTFLYYDPTLTFTASHALVSGSTFNFTSNADTSFTTVWNFGDGSPNVTADNPTHTYAGAGLYNACAYITTSCGIDTVCTTVLACAPPVAGFGSSATGLSVAFTDSSSLADTVYWNFGDGNTAVGPTANHTYAAPGTYTVCQTVVNACTTDSICETITICTAPVAAIGILSSQNGTVGFSDNSQFATSWSWYFGDGNFDLTQNPTHTYTSNGAFNVCLVVNSGCGADTACTTVLACPFLPVASFNSAQNFLDVTFANTSANAYSYIWDFGDGTTDTTANPTHTYAANGTYVVCLAAANICEVDTVFCDTVVVCAAPIAGFTTSTNLLSASFTNTSTGSATYAWDFGDGNTSTSVSPTHTYTASGTYSVCLVSTNDCGDTAQSCQTVIVNSVGVSAAYPGFSFELAPNPMQNATNIMVKADGIDAVYQFTLMDVNGKLIASLEGQFGQAQVLHRNGWASGIYLYRVMSEGKVMASGRLVVE